MTTYAVNRVPWLIYQGSVSQKTVAKDNGGVFQDFTGGTVRCHFRRNPGSANPDFEAVCTLVAHPDTMEANRAISLRVGATASRDVAPGKYNYRLEFVPPSGEDDAELIIGGIAEIISDPTT